MKKFAFILFIFTLFGTQSFAQKEKIYTEKGNAALKNGDVEAAKEAYKKALEINPNYKEAIFNLGNTYQQEARNIVGTASKASDDKAKKEIYQKAQKSSKAAAAQYQKAAEDLKDPDKINKAQYNLGNAELMSGDVDKSIEAYKEALRKVPTDDDARYNLAYAQHMKKKQEQQKQQQNKDQKNQDQKNQDQKKQDQKNQDQKKDKDQKQNQDQKKDDQKKSEQPKQNKDELSKDEAEKMLEALNKQEKDIQDKLKKKKIKVQPIKIEKDW